ncbi:MAG: family 43 glycosylhydrolase [Nocardioides sp.]
MGCWGQMTPLRRLLRVGATWLVALAVVVSLAGAAPAREGDEVAPHLPDRDFADPAVAAYKMGLIAVATGEKAKRAWQYKPDRKWRDIGPALLERPAWSTTGKVWAADIVQAGDQWLLYYAITVRGLRRQSRCIGVAVAPTPLDQFRPLGRHPLVCPKQARAPRAADQVHGAVQPREGVIDPSAFVDDNGDRYLLYKTQGDPATIRILPLDASGTDKAAGERSRELVRGPDTIENPVLVRSGPGFVLFTSEGDFSDCGYRTTWRYAGSLEQLDRVKRHRLFRQLGDQVCGPGGADLVRLASGAELIFFHGWTCYDTPTACEPDFHLRRHSSRRPIRSTYAAELRWEGTSPRVGALLPPPAGPPVVEPEPDPPVPPPPPLP